MLFTRSSEIKPPCLSFYNFRHLSLDSMSPIDKKRVESIITNEKTPEFARLIFKFLSTPFIKRQNVQETQLNASLNEIVETKPSISLTQEILTGDLAKVLFDSFPGTTAQKYAQLNLLISYILTLPTDKTVNFAEACIAANDYEASLCRSALELKALIETEESLKLVDPENDMSFRWIDGKDEDNNAISFYRKAPNGRHLICFHHFGPNTVENYTVRFPHNTYFPLAKHVESVEEIYHSSGALERSFDKRNATPVLVRNAINQVVGFNIQVVPFSTTIVALTINENASLSPAILPAPPLPCIEIVEYKDTLVAQKGSSLEVSRYVEDQLANAATAHLKIDDTYTIHPGDNFDVTGLDAKELACLYYIMNSYLQNKIAAVKNPEKVAPETYPQITIFRTLTFDILDHILRLSQSNREKSLAVLKQLKSYNDSSLSKAIDALETATNPEFRSAFYQFTSPDGNSPVSFKTSALALKVSSKQKPAEPRKLEVWKISLENTNNQVGGLGAVMKASAIAHKTMGLESVKSIHPLYSHEKNSLTAARANLKFKGVIQHEYNGEMVTSSIYKDPATLEYLIQPDQKHRGMFDIYSAKYVYGSFYFSQRQDRYLYTASAAAAAVGTYCGKKGLKSVDVLQADAWHSGAPAMELIQQYINPMRHEKGLNPIEMVYLTHMLIGDLYEQGLIKSKDLKTIGIDTRYFPRKVVLSKRALMHSGANIFVSHGVASDAIDPSIELSKGLRAATLSSNPRKVRGITNGISTEMFDVTNKKSSGSYAVVNNGFLKTQNELKRDLHRAGIIADAEKPLVVFVGRYSNEKGISMLKNAVQEVQKKDGQVVIMGLMCDDEESTRIVKELKELSETPEYNDCLRVYLERGDQMDNFVLNGEDKKLRKGWAIRQAATFALVPSFAEACGLVPLEMQCAGALTIAPYHQGLRDMCMAIAAPNLTKGMTYDFDNGGNAFCYENCRNSEQLGEAIRLGFDHYNGLTDDEKNSLMKRIHAHALSHNDWVVMKDGVAVGGSAYEYSKTYHELFHANNRIEGVETFEEAVARRNLQLVK